MPTCTNPTGHEWTGEVKLDFSGGLFGQGKLVLNRRCINCDEYSVVKNMTLVMNVLVFPFIATSSIGIMWVIYFLFARL